MRSMKKIGVSAALSAAFVVSMLATAPVALAATPAQAGTPVMSGVALGSPAPAGHSYREGYREGYQDGFADGRKFCRDSVQRSDSDKDEGYRDGYQAGFAAGQAQCGG